MHRGSEEAGVIKEEEVTCQTRPLCEKNPSRGVSRRGIKRILGSGKENRPENLKLSGLTFSTGTSCCSHLIPPSGEV